MSVTTQELPRSYLTEARRQGLSQNGIYLAESQAADEAGDEETSWAWLALAEIPAYALMGMKIRQGAEFIRKMGFRTETAEAVYGKNWLER
ncbi:MAG: hypothetical protein LBR88_07155 [Zoogloeaceae bacterium]|jgi:hypothetical protein|nr:hypothetical protein [Zoogloeaceae bacterium]